MSDLNLFRFSHPVEVRYRDADMQGHVNNAVYFTYMETARGQYARQILSWDGDPLNLSIIIARAELDYLKPLYVGDIVRVYLRTSRLGSKSFDFEYVLVREPVDQPPPADPIIAGQGFTVQVAYDYRANATIPIPADWRAALMEFEPGLLT